MEVALPEQISRVLVMPDPWREISVSGHVVDLFQPAAKRSPLAVVFLHGMGNETLTDNAAFTRFFELAGMFCLSPHGGTAWWSDRICRDFDPQMTAEEFIRNHVAAYARNQLGAMGIGLLGISMGGQGALRLAFKFPHKFPAVAAISPAIDYYEYYGQGLSLDEMYTSKEQCRQDTATMHIRPNEYPPHIFFCIDPDDLAWFRGNDRLHEKLMALGIPHTCDLTSRAGGHSWTYFDHMAERAIRFIHDGLVAQSRRLL
jgi:S-formylglutathione hydrolase